MVDAERSNKFVWSEHTAPRWPLDETISAEFVRSKSTEEAKLSDTCQSTDTSVGEKP